MQLGAKRAEFFDQRSFDEMMDVLGLRIVEPRSIGFRTRLESIERGDQLFALFLRENSRAGNGTRPRPIERDFLRQQTPVEFPGALKFVERRIGTAFEAASPPFPLAGGLTP